MEENNEMRIAGTIGVPMDQLIVDLVQKINNDSALSSLFYSALENFKVNVKTDSKDTELLYAFCVGWILNDLIRTTFAGCDSNSKISQLMRHKRENLIAYKTRLEDGNEFVISTDKEEVIDNEFISKLEKQTGYRFTNPFVKITKEEADKIHSSIIKHLENASEKI